MSEVSTKELLGELGSANLPVANAKEKLGQRARMLDHIQRLQSELHARQLTRARRTKLLTLAMAAAACVFLGVGLRSLLLETSAEPPLHVSVVSGAVNVGEQRHNVHQEVEVHEEDSVTTGKLSVAQLKLDSGVEVQLSAASEIRFAHSALREQISLLSGAVSVRVPKLLAGATFGVKTFDSEVEVHGTQFSVSVEDVQDRRFTRVDVREGVVSVKSGSHQVVLRANDEWTSFPASAASSVSAPPRTPRNAAKPFAGASAPRLSQAPPPSAAAPSDDDAAPDQPPAISPPQRGGTQVQARADPSPPSPMAAAPASQSPPSALAEQNARFAEAKAELYSNPSRGIALLEHFVYRYPESMHVQSALVERMRALSRMGRRREAARTAQRYIAAFPNGFALKEAQRLAVEH